MGHNKESCRYTDNQVRDIRHRYNRVRLIKNQMKSIRREIKIREDKLSVLREESRDIRGLIIEDYGMSVTTLWTIGEGLARRDVKE